MAPRKPNYRFERQERERLKAAKKAEKAAKRAAGGEDEPQDGAATETQPDADSEAKAES